MKIYRICNRVWTGKIKECAYVSSLERACDYIKEQIPEEAEIHGYHRNDGNRRVYHLEKNNTKFINALKNGYCVGGVDERCYINTSYWVDIINV